MTISVFLDPLLMPSQGQAQATLDANVAQFFSNLPVFCAQFNAEVANVNASLNGAGISIPYTIDLSSTADGDPGNGKLRFSSTTQNASAVLRLDLLSSNTADYTAVLDTFDASTSATKGRIALIKQGDAKTFLIFDVTARAAPAGYRNLTVTPVASSSASPFLAGDPVLMYFQRTGDRGNPGTTGYAKFSDQKPNGTAGGSSLAAPGSINVRDLNTTQSNNIGATLSANGFTLPSGNYVIEARAPAYTVGSHRAAIRNGTDNSYLEYGSTAVAPTGFATQTDSIVVAYVSLSASKTFFIWHATQNAVTNGLGFSCSLMGAAEVYTEVSVWKLS